MIKVFREVTVIFACLVIWLSGAMFVIEPYIDSKAYIAASGAAMTFLMMVAAEMIRALFNRVKGDV